MSSVSLAMDASSWSISACRVSTASVFSFRVCSLVESSVSHQPLCSASSLASSMRRVRRSLIIFFTLRKGSSATRPASIERTRLLRSRARACRYEAALDWTSLRRSALRAASDAACCAREGRCLSALPDTASLEMISMALLRATSSSERSCCRATKSVAFCSHVAVSSLRYCTSALLVVVVSSRSPSVLALACSLFALVADFWPLSWVACRICAFRSCISIPYACCVLISSLSRVVRSATNLSSSFASTSMTPWDWNS
mmetsp:Transcript_29540/g.84862  ORF Transcript_29540/g.84862 Transcript_29540/m.84862 type:complete len:258 (-) Transcript_29540:730-1503(-)